MKIKRTVAALLCAALTLSACGALVACGGDDDKSRARGTASLDLSDYASSVATETPAAARTELKLINPASASVQDENSFYKIFATDSSPASYSVYFIQTEQLMNVEEYPVFESYYSPSINVLRLSRTSVSTGVAEYAFYAPDGTKLLDFARYMSSGYYSDSLNLSYVYRYEGDNRYSTKILKVSATVIGAEKNEEVTKYFKVDEKTHSYTSYTPVDESALKEKPTYLLSEYAAGGVSGLSEIRYTSNNDLEWSGALSDYRTKRFGNITYFYKNGSLTGTVDLSDGETLGFVGNNFYYYTITTAAPESSSYNVAVQMQGALVKGNYKLFKYDVVNNSTSELATDVMITDLEPVYNYRLKAYDAAYINGVKKTDGVYYMANFSVEGMPDTSDDTSIYFVDSELNTAAELPEPLLQSGFKDIYKLAENRFRVGSYIVDNGFNYVSDVSGLVYESEKLISFTYDGKTGLKDLDGKIVVAPEYESIGTFYGGVALASKKNKDGKLVNLLLGKTGIETALPQTDADAGVTLIEPYYPNGLYLVARKANNKYNVTVFNYANTELKTFSGLDSIDRVQTDFAFVKYRGTERDEVYKIK